MAHEFRSPLTIIKGALDNVVDGLHGPLTTDQSEPVVMCQKEANRLKRLVGDLLDLARIESGKVKLVQDRVVLQEVLSSVAQLFSAMLKKRELHLTMELPQEPIVLLGDSDRLKQVFVNLFGNATKFTGYGGIDVRLVREGEFARVEVADTGPGIAPGDLERIFDKFERVGETQETEGSGLGLPIARDIVTLHHGRLWAESIVGRGSRFIVQLPLKLETS